jgi:MFS family permease
VVAAATGGLVFHALMYGPQAAFIAEQLGTRVRYSGASMGYQVAGIFGGALAPIIATALLAWSGSWVAISVYVVAALGVTMVALVAARETARDDFEGRPRRFVREREREREPTSAATG